MTARDALDQLWDGVHIAADAGECECPDCTARAVLLRLIEQHAGAMAYVGRKRGNFADFELDELEDALTKGNQ